MVVANGKDGESTTNLERSRPSTEELEKILSAHETWLETEEVQGKRADLSEVDLSGVDLRERNLRRAYFRGTILRGAHLDRADLRESNFNLADLTGASLLGARLDYALLSLCILSRADLQGAILYKTNLNRANLRSAYLFGADLQKAALNGADLSDANLKRADMTEANLRHAVLTNASLNCANLTGAQLPEARLQGADLRDANLEGANLDQADFDSPPEPVEEGPSQSATQAGSARANLSGARFRRALLHDARISNVTGLQSHQLAGADLSNAKLPDDIKDFEGLRYVEELSKHSRALFISLIGGCMFSWLTIATTTDVALLTNSTSTPLPIIQTNVPIAGFYLTTPVILLAVYFYLHLYLQNLWDGLSSLPAIFPDGRGLARRAYPWPLTSLVNVHVPMLRERRPNLSHARAAFSVVAAWGLVPFTLALFWLRYLPRHEWPGTAWLAFILVVSVWSGVAFYQRASLVLRTNRDTLKRGGNVWEFIALGITTVAALAISTSSFWYGYESRPENDSYGRYLFANLKDAEVSQKLDGWIETANADGIAAQIAHVKGAELPGWDLRLANAPGAFMVKANLGGADLRGANLSGADLRGANLQGADLRCADLRGADLQGTDFAESWIYAIKPGPEAGSAFAGAMNFEKAYRDQALSCDEPLPEDSGRN